jgi:Family of unknown function (DUF6326)
MRPQEAESNVKIRLAGAWTALMALFIYADFLSLYRPGELEEIRNGVMGPVDVSQATLLLASAIVIIPAVMIVASLMLPAGANRSLNLALAFLYSLINIGNVLVETWAYYLLFGVAELGITAFIFLTAWRWPKENPSVRGSKSHQ